MAAVPKVLFVSTWVNHPELISIQRDLIKKFCQEDAAFLAVLDGKSTPCYTNFGDSTMRQQQIDTCKAADISFVEVPPHFHKEPYRGTLFAVQPPGKYTPEPRNCETDYSSRAAVANQFAWRVFHEHLIGVYDYLVMIQSDIFPFTSFSVRDMLEGNSLLYKSQARGCISEAGQITYAWDGFLMFDFRKEILPWHEWNFDCGEQAGIGTDTGGGTWCFLPKIQLKKAIDARNSLQWDVSDPEFALLPPPIREFIKNDVRNEGDTIFSEIKHHTFIHLRGGGNWEFIQDPSGITRQQLRFQEFMKCCEALKASATI